MGIGQVVEGRHGCVVTSDSYRVGVRVRAGTVVGFARFEVAQRWCSQWKRWLSNKQLTQKKKFDTGARRLTLSRECLRVRVDLGAA